jgi:hypothetical protein
VYTDEGSATTRTTDSWFETWLAWEQGFTGSSLRPEEEAGGLMCFGAEWSVLALINIDNSYTQACLETCMRTTVPRRIGSHD